MATGRVQNITLFMVFVIATCTERPPLPVVKRVIVAPRICRARAQAKGEGEGPRAPGKKNFARPDMNQKN